MAVASFSYDFESISVPILGPLGSTVSLEQILAAAFGPSLGGYSDFYVAYQGSQFYRGANFSYWDPADPAVSQWFNNGADITYNASPYWAWDNASEVLQVFFTNSQGVPNPHLVHVTAADVDQITFVLGNPIAAEAFILVPVAYDANHIPTTFTQYSVTSGFDAGLVSSTGAPTPADVVAAAQRFAAAYPDVINDNDCAFIAAAVAAAAGAVVTPRAQSTDPSLNESAGFWRVFYRGSDPDPVVHWSALVQPGDIVRMGWTEGDQHTTTVLAKSETQNPDGTYNLTVYDNIAYDSRGNEIIGIHPDTINGENYDTLTDATTITIFRLAPDHLYLITGADGGQILSGTIYNDDIVGGAGDDTVNASPGTDQVNGGSGANAVEYHGKRSEYSIVTYLDTDGLLHTSVIDQGAAQDGNDDLLSIQGLKFADFATELNGADLNHASNVAGSRFDDVLFQDAATGQVHYAAMVDGVLQGLHAVTGPLGTDWQAIASGNVDPSPTNRAAETFVQQQSTGTIYYASLEAGETTWGVVSTGLTADWKLRAVADVSGDASVDAIVQNQADGTIYYANMSGGMFQNWGVVYAGLNNDWVAVGAGDVNSDGFADVVVQQQSTGTTYYADMANGVFGGWVVVANGLTPNWQAKAVADVTGDGFADVIFQNLAGSGVAPGTTYFADMQNGVLTRWGVVTTNVTGAWVAQGTADVDNDGFNDVLFQNATNGTTYYANMGPAGFEGWGAVVSNISADWQVV